MNYVFELKTYFTIINNNICTLFLHLGVGHPFGTGKGRLRFPRKY